MPVFYKSAPLVASLVVLLSLFFCSGSQVFAQETSASKVAEEAADKPADKLDTADKTDAVTTDATKEAKGAEEVVVVEEEDIISISDALKQGQIQHEKNLVDKFLLGIAVLFLVIAFLLFNSLPPSSPESN